MLLFYIFLFILCELGIIANAMEEKCNWQIKKEIKIEQELREGKITREQANSYRETIKKKSSVIGAHEKYINALEKNRPDEVKFYYNQYADYVENFKTDFGHTLENPYRTIAQKIHSDSVGKMIELISQAWPLNAKNSIGYWHWYTVDKNNKEIVSYSYTNPAGYAILYGNKNMLNALLDQGINCAVPARREGKQNILFSWDEVSYNAFEYSILSKKSDFAQLIYDKNATIVYEGLPLKIAFEMALKKEFIDRIKFFSFVHNLIYNQKKAIDHTLLQKACIEYGDFDLTEELLKLGYKGDIKTGWLGLTVTEQIVDMFKNVEKVSCDITYVTKLIILFKKMDAFTILQEEKINKLVDERIDFKANEDYKKSKEYAMAKIINDASLKWKHTIKSVSLKNNQHNAKESL